MEFDANRNGDAFECAERLFGTLLETLFEKLAMKYSGSADPDPILGPVVVMSRIHEDGRTW
jgi:hypothetical protein